MSAPELFNRTLRRVRRERAAPRFVSHDFVRADMAAELLERLAGVTRSFGRVLELGAPDLLLAAPLRAGGMHVVQADPAFALARAHGGVQCDEDRLPFADASFDLIVSAGGLESVNDLPGALTLVRRILRPDGLFLGALAGAPSLISLKPALLAGELATGAGARARIHPQIEVRAAGDLLSRAGFALPVADRLTLTARYASIFALMADLRFMAATNLLDSGRAPLQRAALAAAAEAFAARADPDGKTAERFEIIVLTGWAPSPDQPKPARRGSGERLGDVLGKPR